MTEARVLVKFSDDSKFKITAIRSIRSLSKAVHPDGEPMGLRAAKEAVEGGVLMTIGQFELLVMLFNKSLPDDEKDYPEGFYICNVPMFLTL